MASQKRRGGRNIRKRDLEDEAVESIKRNASGTIQHTNVVTKSGTTVTTTGFTTTTKVDRAFASSVNLTISTTGTAGGGGATIKRGGTTIASTTIANGNTTATTGTFTSAPATWTLSISVTTGTVTITSWTVSQEDVRG